MGTVVGGVGSCSVLLSPPPEGRGGGGGHFGWRVVLASGLRERENGLNFWGVVETWGGGGGDGEGEGGSDCSSSDSDGGAEGMRVNGASRCVSG